jgi:cysteine desulfurase family protein (TIGR01976 family)
MAYDVARIRACFPALAEGAAHFDGPGGSQVPRQVGDAVASTLTSAISNRSQVTRSGRRAEDVVVSARAAMGDFLRVDPSGVVFGRSMTQLTFDVSRALAASWRPGDQVLVTRLDHDANVRPWVLAAERSGVDVGWVDFDPETGELHPDSVAAVITDRTRLVAITAASNLIGTRPDLPAISRMAHEAGALVYVDGVHYSPHVLPDVPDLAADLFACSPYKFCGPHCGVLAADPALLERLRPDKLLPSADGVPDRFELGTLPYEVLAGTTAAVEFLAGLGDDLDGERRERLAASYGALGRHEERLRQRLERGLDSTGAVRYSRASSRTPTVLFELPGIPSAEVARALAEAGVNAPAGSFYALLASRRLGLGDVGAVRAGVAAYTDDTDVDRLLAVVASLG